MTDSPQSHSVYLRQDFPQNSPSAITEADVLITAALADRPASQPDLAAENQALQTLAQQLMDEPQSVLKTLVQTAKDLCQADTAGVCLLETLADGTSVFRWVAIVGALEAWEQTTAPAHFSPCETTIRCGCPQLYARPEHYFSYLHHPQFPIVEGLLLPLCVNDQPLGTLWIISHNEQRRFDGEDQRLMTSLAGFTATALQSIRLRQMAEVALQREQAAKLETEATRQALNAADQRAIDILESITDAFICLDQEWRITYANQEAARLNNLQPAEMIGKTHWEMWPWSVGTIIEQTYRQVVADRVAAHFEVLYEPLNMWLEIHAYPAPSGLSVYFRDITERKHMEVALRESQNRIQTTLANVPGMVYRYIRSANGSQRFVFVSSGCQDLFEVDPDTALRDSNAIWTLIHPDDRSSFQASVATAVENFLPWEWSGRIITPSGQLKWIQGRSNAGLTADGEAWDGWLVDITERKQTEEALWESEAVNRSVFESSADCIKVLDLNGYLLSMNGPGLCLMEIEDCTPLIGTSWLEFWQDSDRTNAENAINTAKAGGTGRFSGYCPTAKGTPKWWDVVVTPILDVLGKLKQLLVISRDITDRKQAELEIRKFVSLADNSMEFIGMCDMNFVPFYLNEAGRRMIGLDDAQQYSTTPVREFFFPEDQDFIVNEFFPLVLREGRAEVEIRFRHFKTGEALWMIYNVFYLRGESDQPIGLATVSRNITDRKQAEVALRQSESRLRLIIESAKDYAIFALDLHGTIATWNSGAERLLGYTEAEAIGCNGRMIFTPEDNERKQAEWEMQTTLTQGRAEDERWHLRKDGSRFWASGLMMPLQDEAGNMRGFVKIMQDKTAQRQVNERFQLLYDMTSDLLATEQPLALMHNLFNKLSVQLELHCYYNYMVEEKDNRLMLHLRNYEGISEDAAKAVEWIELGEHLCGLVAQQQRQIVLAQAQINTHPNAHLVCLSGSTAYAGQPLIVQGRLLGTLSFTSRTRTHFTREESDLLQSTCDQIAIAIDRANLMASIQQQTEQLQHANRIKDEFLAVLSHELRSPLNPILGWSKLLQTGKLDEAKTAQALATIERNAKLQSELIEDLLDVSRILQGKLSLHVSPVNLASIIKAAVETVRLAAEAKSIQVEVSLDPNVSPVSGDATRLQQVVWNLLSNAVKFTPAGGRVEVRLDQGDGGDRRGEGNEGVRGDTSLPSPASSSFPPSPTSPPPSYAQITVTDTGKGIHPDFLPHVFDYFRQADSATTRKFGGLGLGLAIVRHLVELHGGTVEADSPGEELGATFITRLPLMPLEPMDKQEEQFSQSSLNLQGVQVLVVDDDADTRELVVFLLEQAGASVIAVASADEAFTAFSQSQPDLLISDIGMPEMDGYMLIRQIRELPSEKGGQLPAIALTAYAGEGNQQQALAAGFECHIAKPFEPESLMQAIVSLVQKRSVADGADYK